MHISIYDFSKICDKVNIIDIRSKRLYSDGHIPNAVNIDPYALVLNPQQFLDIYNRYYIYCETGLGSGKLCDILSRRGYEVVNIDGGFDSWLKWKLT